MTNEIFKKIPLVMAEIGAIGKDRKNPQQGYSFRGIDDIYNAANAVLSAHGVFCVPVCEDIKREERQTQKGGTLFYTILTVKYIFYASDGSSVEARTIGEAMDSGDKSANKAMSAAQKYAFLQIFCIPTEEPHDTETETHEVAPKTDGSSKGRTGAFEAPNAGSSPAKTPPNFADNMRKAFAYVGTAAYFKTLGGHGYTSIDEIPDEKQDEILAELRKLPKEVKK